MSAKGLVEQIRHYQKDIERCPENAERMIRCIQRLYVLPILVEHLQETGVGRSVNSLRKYNGEVGNAAKALVAKWKAMVAAEESNEAEKPIEEPKKPEPKVASPPQTKQHKDKERQEKNHRSKSSHKDRDKLEETHKRDKSSDRHNSSRKHLENGDKHKHHSNKRSHSDTKSSNEDKPKRKESSDSDSSPSRKKCRKYSSKSESKHKQVKEESPSEKSESEEESDSEKESERSSEEAEESEESGKSESEDSESDHSSDHRHRSKHQHKSSHHKSSHSRSSSNCKRKDSSSSQKSSRDLKEMIKANEKRVKKEKAESKDVKEPRKSKTNVKIERNEDGSIDQGSGASFADALLGASYPAKKKKKSSKETSRESPKLSKTSHSSSKSSSSHRKSSPAPYSSDNSFKMPEALTKPIKLEPVNLDISSTLPDILPNYKPLPHVPENNRRNAKQTMDEDTMFSLMTTKNLRTKVYSGAKTGVYQQVPSLYNLCLQLLSANIDALEFTGGVPYDILKPLLEKLNADQLYVVEHYNPYLIEETDPLWHFHCKKDFRGKQCQEMESWRDLYLRCMDERERKLKAVTSNINHSIAKSTPVRTAKLAYVDSVVKPPRNVARKQAKYGTASSSSSSPSSKPSSSNSESKQQLLLKAVVGGHTPGGLATTTVPAPPHPTSRTSSQIVKKKKAPLMAKALQLIKGNRFKR